MLLPLQFGKERGVSTHSWRILEGEKGKKLINFEILKANRSLKTLLTLFRNTGM
jgi:hypothetical protein